MTERRGADGLVGVVRGEVLLPGRGDYEVARRVFNAMIDRKPSLIVRCSGAADVIAAVNYAGAEGLPLSVKGGGHSVAGTAVCDGGIMVEPNYERVATVKAAYDPTNMFRLNHNVTATKTATI